MVEARIGCITPDQGKRTGPAKCQSHEWVVYSTALADCCLMLQCVECGMHGVVEDPTREEWGEGFHAPNRPYRWLDDSRVVVQGPCDGIFFVTGQKAQSSHASSGDSRELDERLAARRRLDAVFDSCDIFALADVAWWWGVDALDDPGLAWMILSMRQEMTRNYPTLNVLDLANRVRTCPDLTAMRERISALLHES